jgi:hypothetical protein
VVLGKTDSFVTVKDPCASSLRQDGSALDAACDAQGVPDDVSDPRPQQRTILGGNAAPQHDFMGRYFYAKLSYNYDQASRRDALRCAGAVTGERDGPFFRAALRLRGEAEAHGARALAPGPPAIHRPSTRRA